MSDNPPGSRLMLAAERRGNAVVVVRCSGKLVAGGTIVSTARSAD